eukprot:14484940-Ditylum_brightwellii.AAC.1
MQKVILTDRVKAWAFGSLQHVKSVVKNVEEYLEMGGVKLPTKVETPIHMVYHLQLDVPNELDAIHVAYHPSLIGTYAE